MMPVLRSMCEKDKRDFGMTSMVKMSSKPAGLSSLSSSCLCLYLRFLEVEGTLAEAEAPGGMIAMKASKLAMMIAMKAPELAMNFVMIAPMLAMHTRPLLNRKESQLIWVVEIPLVEAGPPGPLPRTHSSDQYGATLNNRCEIVKRICNCRH